MWHIPDNGLGQAEVLQRLSRFEAAVRESTAPAVQAEHTWWALSSKPKKGMQYCEKAVGPHVLLLHEQLGVSEADLKYALNMQKTRKLTIEILNTKLGCEAFLPGNWNDISFVAVKSSSTQAGVPVAATPSTGVVMKREWPEAKALLLEVIKQEHPTIAADSIVPTIPLNSAISSRVQNIDFPTSTSRVVLPVHEQVYPVKQRETITSEREHATPPVQKGARDQKIHSNVKSFKAFLPMQATTK